MPLPTTLIEGKYEILEKLREGGMGTIYKVHHRLLDEVRVIKVIRGEHVADAELKGRFLDEAKVATRLKHPNIGVIHDFALGEDGTAYLVMEFIDGVNLADLVHTQGPLGVPLTIEIGHQALLALGYLHRKNVVHRDIAPDNFMLTRGDEGQPLVKLIDLGVAKALDKGGDRTSTGVFLGKLQYASPEQYGNLPPGEKLDGRSDLYSLGVVLYLLLTGKRPFKGEAPAELLRAHLLLPPIPFSETDPGGKVPLELRALIMRALEKKREDRFPSADAFDRELLSLRDRFAAPEELEHTVADLSLARLSSVRPPGTVTPSAQNRLDLQFAAGSTPMPTADQRSEAVTLSSTAGITAQPARSVRAAPPPPAVAPPAVAGRKPLVWLFAAAVLAVAGTAAVLWIRTRQTPATTVVSQKQALAVAAVPTAAATAEPAAAVPAPQPAAPGAAEAAATGPALRPTAAPEKPRQLRPAAQPIVRPSAPARQATVPGPRDNVPPAQAQQAQLVPPTVAPQPEAPRPTAVPIASAAEAPKQAPPSPQPPAHPAPSDQDRIRETMRAYQEALSKLDVGLYARVYPALAGDGRRQVGNAWEALRSQEVEIDIHQIELKGSRATVRFFQRVTAVPRVGTEQRDARERSFELEKRGDAWVITRLN